MLYLVVNFFADYMKQQMWNMTFYVQKNSTIRERKIHMNKYGQKQSEF